MAVYVLFEAVTLNYRPVLINGILEASYPSSTTLLVTTVMPVATMQLKSRIKHLKLKRYLIFTIRIFIAFMVLGRLVSGVHWITDIIGGLLLSAALVTMYIYLTTPSRYK
jgi:undecaprenyl-diphosphatase